MQLICFERGWGTWGPFLPQISSSLETFSPGYLATLGEVLFRSQSCRTPARRWSQWPSFHSLALLHICCFSVCWISSCQVSDAYWLLQNSASHSQRKIDWCWVGGEGGVAILDVSKHGSLLRINRKSWIKSLGFDKGFFSETIKDFFPLPLLSHPPKE